MTYFLENVVGYKANIGLAEALKVPIEKCNYKYHWFSRLDRLLNASVNILCFSVAGLSLLKNLSPFYARKI